MRIFLAIQKNTNSAIPTNSTWYRNLYEPLLELGHKVVLFDTSEAIHARRKKNRSLKAKVSQKLIDVFRKENDKNHFDVFIGYFTEGMLDFEVIEQIRKSSVITLNFSCNNTHQFYLVKNISKHFDFSLYAEKEAKKHFDSIQVSSIWWPMASNPKYFHPKNLPKNYKVTFVGANYGLRTRYISYLLDNGIDVSAFGPGWKYGSNSLLISFLKRYLLILKTLCISNISKQARYSGLLAEHDYKRNLATKFPLNLFEIITDEKLIDLYSESEISLGFLEVYNHHDPSKMVLKHMHLRDFEAPLSGAFYMTGFSDEVAEMFEPDKEVVIYRSSEELLDKINYYLKNSSAADQIRKAGFNRAINQHTYHHRYKSLFAELGL